MVEFLDGQCACDTLSCRQYGADKIQTIGDSYWRRLVSTGGKPGALSRSTSGAAMMRIERQPRGDCKSPARRHPLRAGDRGHRRLASPMMSGVMPNTASRMGHGEPGRIQVSEAFRDRTVSFCVRGTRSADIKSLGATGTFFLVGPRGPGTQRGLPGFNPARPTWPMCRTRGAGLALTISWASVDFFFSTAAVAQVKAGETRLRHERRREIYRIINSPA